MENVSSRPSRRPFLWPLLVVALGGAAFTNSLHGTWILDDIPQIVENPAVHRGTGFWTGMRPLTYATFALNCALGGTDVRGYHFVNVAIHLVGGLALYGIARRVLMSDRFATPWRENADLLAFATAALWVVHPLQTQAVTYVVQRCESLMGMFYLLALYALVRGATTAGTRWPWYLASVVCYFGSAASKEVAITFPVVALIFDWTFLAQRPRGLVGRLPVYVAYAIGALWVVVQVSPALVFPSTASTPSEPNVSLDPSAGFGIPSLTPWMYLRSQPAVLLHYLRLSFWPDDLCLDYVWQVENDPLRIYGFGLVILGLLTASVLLTMRGRWLGALGLVFFVVLAPTSSFVPILDLAFEHRMYLSLACLTAIVSAAIWWAIARAVRIPTQQRQAFVVVVLAIAFLLAGRTWLRNRDYFDPLAMWAKVVRQAPLNGRAHLNKAILLAERGHAEAAENEFIAALKYAPDGYKVHYGYARFLAAQGRREAAEQHFREAIALWPGYKLAYVGLGNLHARDGQFQVAITHYRQALELDPHYLPAQRVLAFSLVHLGEMSEAIPLLESLGKLVPGDTLVKAYLARALATAEDDALRDGTRALQLAQEGVVATQRGNVEALEALACALAEVKQFADAEAAAEEAALLARKQGQLRDAERLEAYLPLLRQRQPLRAKRANAPPD